MRVKNDAFTLAQSIDSCIDALDELIITYHECTDESVQIIENKKLQYPDKIMVIPYPYHVIGVGATDEEYEYAKTLPIGHPQLLATYYNNALQYVNYKYVMKIDADQLYFSQDLKELRDSIVNGVHQNGLARLCGKVVSKYFYQKLGSKEIWSKYHLLHWLQFVIVPLFKKQYVEYAISELLKGKCCLSLSGVNVLHFHNQWYSPLGCKLNDGGIIWPYMGIGDHLVFEAGEQTEYVPWDYKTGSGKKVMIEKFEDPIKTIFNIGFFWFHFKPMKKPFYTQLISYFREFHNSLIPTFNLGKVQFNRLLTHLDQNCDGYYIVRRNYFNFVHNLDKKAIRDYFEILSCTRWQN